MHHANLEKLKSLRLFGMARALQELVGLDDRGQLDFDDQLALLIERETADVLQRAARRPGHIFNLGHGILPQTTPDAMARVVNQVHGWQLVASAT